MLSTRTSPPSVSTAPLDIAFVGEYPPDDLGVPGANSHARLIASLRARGHRVHGLDCELRGLRRATVAARLYSRDRERWRGRFHLHPVAFAARSAVAKRLLGEVQRRHRLDAVIQYGTAFDGRVAGVPHLIWTDTTSAVTATEPYSWMGALPADEQRRVHDAERRLMEQTDIIMPWSRYAGESIAAVAGAPRDRIRPTYVGPSVEIPVPAPRTAPPRETPATIRVLFIGREFDRKGGDVFLEAVRRVRARGIDLVAMIAGPTRLDVSAPHIEFLGFLDKRNPADVQALLDAYARADLFCLPTRREPFGLVIMEAMLAGLPVVATRLSAIPEMVQHEETGYLVERDDVDDLSARLETLATTPELRLAMGRRGEAYARQRFTWDAVAAAVEAGIREAIAARTR